jgi:hypothetical protein
MLTVCTWLWGQKFAVDDVAKLAAGVRRHLRQPHRFVCFSDRRFELDGVEDGILPNIELTKVRGCFVRLRMFDPSWQMAWFSGRIVSVDLDTVITGPLDPLFDRDEPFVIMQGANSANPCPFNGALQMLRAGYRPDVWSDFSLDAAAKVPFHSFPDDQGWLHAKIPDAAGWKVGPEHGVYVYQKRGWPGGKATSELPEGARLVTFINKHPGDVAHLGWVKEHWR